MGKSGVLNQPPRNNRRSRAGTRCALPACPEQRCSEEVSLLGECKQAAKKRLCGGCRVKKKKKEGHLRHALLQQEDAQNMLGPFACGYESGRWLVRCLYAILSPRPTARAVTSPKSPHGVRSQPNSSAPRGLCSLERITAIGQPVQSRSLPPVAGMPWDLSEMATGTAMSWDGFCPP